MIEDGKEQGSLVFPGTTVTAGGGKNTYYEPVAYPVLETKIHPEWALGLLYTSFIMMTIGLYLCFFQIPEAAHVKSDGITVVGRKDISMQIEQYRSEMK